MELGICISGIPREGNVIRTDAHTSTGVGMGKTGAEARI